jgi:hypothetical protein
MSVSKKIFIVFEHITLPLHQVFAFVVTGSLLVYMGYKPFTDFRFSDPRPELQTISPAVYKEWGGKPSVVVVGLYITDFPEFNVIKNSFIFDGVIWFEFDPALVSIEAISKFSFEKGEMLERSAPDSKSMDGKLFLQYHIRVRFSTNLNFAFFPFDDHRIYIALINRFVSPVEMIYDADLSNFSVAKTVFTAGWLPVDYAVTAGYAHANLNEFDQRKKINYPKVVFSIDFQREGIQGILLIILPLILICFIGLYAFALDPKHNASLMLSLASGSIASMIAYRFVIQQISQ